MIQLVCVLVIGLITPVAPTQGGEALVPDELGSRVDELLTAYEQYGFSGAVLVSKGGRVVFEGGYGLANRASAEPNTPATRFDFASIAKTFTGAAALALEAEGLLSVSDHLEEHLGAMPEEKSSATVWHLATHKAGLAHRTRSELDYSPNRAVWIRSMKDAPFESEPGASYRYTNAGTSLLAALVEEVAGEPFEEVVRERLFGRAGLASTGFYPDFEPGRAGLALGYTDETVEPAPPEYGDWTWGLRGSTGIVSTVGDIHQWFRRLHSGEVLPPEQTARAFDASETEAFGWHTETDDQGRAFIHKGGGLSAMQSQILAWPDEDVVVVWAHNNMARNWRRALNRGLTGAALGDAYVQPPRLAAKRKASSGVAGTWVTPSGTLLELVETDEGLTAGGNGFGLPSGSLRSTTDGAWVSFDVERVSTLVLSSGPEGELLVRLEPEGTDLTLSRTEGSVRSTAGLSKPGASALAAARQAAAWLMSGDAESLWNASAYRPLRGANSRDDWQQRIGFVAGRLGGEAALIEEAWALRDGTWRYWRTFESEGGMRVVLRLALSEAGEILAYGLNPLGAEPEETERRPVG